MSISQLVLVSRETRTVLTASFLKTPKLKKWSIEQGNLWERNSSNAQIRTLLDEQRQKIIAEYCEKIGQHELQAAHAEEQRRILREELWRHQLDFREIHQQSLTEMEELRKFQSSTFDTLARRKLIEDQNTILELWGTTIEEPLHMSTAKKSERPEQNRDLRCQTGPSAKDSVIFSGGDSSKNYGADQQRLQISDLHFDKFPTPATFACWKIRFKTEVCTCSKFPSEAMQWIKEVEMVDSVDELRSSSSTRGISMPNFEVLDARIASALHKIIQNSHVKRRISLEEHKAQKEGRFLRGRQIAYLIYDHFGVTWSHDSVENYADPFTISQRNDDIQEFDSKWDGNLLSMTKIPHDEILEGLYKLRIRESEKLKTVLELYDLETHQKKLGPDYHRLKAMVKRSIEQEIRNENFGVRSGNFEKNAVVKNQGTKQRVQRILGDCWQWEANGQCSKGDN